MERSPSPSPGKEVLTPLPNLAAWLQQEKQRIRAAFAVRSLTEEEGKRWDDQIWAETDSDVAEKFMGEFVVAVDRKIVAHGQDAAAVLAEASRITGIPEEKLPLAGIVPPWLDLRG